MIVLLFGYLGKQKFIKIVSLFENPLGKFLSLDTFVPFMTFWVVHKRLMKAGYKISVVPGKIILFQCILYTTEILSMCRGIKFKKFS